MQFAYNEDENLLRQAVDRFVESRYARAQRQQLRCAPSAYSKENWQGLADLGLLGLVCGVEEGGLGGGARQLSAIMEALGNGMVVEPMLEEVIIGGRLLALLGDDAHRLEWLPRIMSGEAHVVLAHFEHTARFNLSDVRVLAQSRAGSWTLGGEKSVVPWAAGANLWIVSAREHGAPDAAEGIGFFLVDPAADGIERRDFRLTDGSPASSIRFRGTAAARLPGNFERFSSCVDFARLAAAAEMLGIMSTMFESTLEYLRTRKQFGAPLSSFQALQHKLANLYVQLEQSRSHVARAALFLDSEVDAHSSVAGMKSYVGRTAIELGEACIHLHGGIGMSDELALGYGFKRLLVLAHLFGDPDAELARFTHLRGIRRDAGTGHLAQARA